MVKQNFFSWYSIIWHRSKYSADRPSSKNAVFNTSQKGSLPIAKNHSVCYKNGKQYKNVPVPHNIALALILMKELNYHMQ